MASSSPINQLPSPDYNPRSPVYDADDVGSDWDGLEWLYWRDHVDLMPRLPVDRPRCLTPSGFREGDDQDQQRPVAACQASPWFKLPIHPRHDILRLTFGDKKVHMCLSFKDTERPVPIPSEPMDIAERNLWRWRGCICSRQEDMSLGPMTRGGHNKGPWVDDCCAGTLYREKIGIMGWLRSCRQNYAETINILYKYNTIVLSGEATIEHLNRLVIRPRLEMITSLEVKCPVVNIANYNAAPGDIGIDSHGFFKMVLDLVRHNFTNIKRLYISMEPKIQLGGYDLIQDIEAFDKFIREMPRFEECALALPDLLFDEDKVSHSIKDFYDRRTSYSQIWRQLGGIGTWKPGKNNIRNYSRDDNVRGKFTSIQLPWVDSYPKPPYHLGENPGPGYWILEACEMPINSGSDVDWDGNYTGTDEWPF
ncbi:hypothetical protein F53441_4816 [Fusarium austroafricanum]|uniref:DUF7730 domain-containing protein n=1 Tax=Fusarium austroafricanum TaxID=2364996 RepID=A0A8H4P0A2_9HYPO|nr:hypothetical protein F53441_4816 [Fusarium austroafricanum]